MVACNGNIVGGGLKTPPQRPAVSPLLNRLLFVAAWTLFALSDRGRAQQRAFDATHLSAPRELNSEWLMQVGDAPSFAEPGFDDSHWTSVDLNTPLTQALHGGRPRVVWYRRCWFR
jgi:hypothetical protein